LCACGGKYFHRLATLQWYRQGRQPTVHPASHTAVADIGMDRVGKVHSGGAARQLENFAFGCEHVNLVREQVNFDVLDKLKGITGGLLHFQQTLHPLPGPRMTTVGILAVTFIQPVGGYAIVGHIFHFPSTNLDLYRDAVHTFEHRVQGLIAVGFGNGDIVLEFSRDGLIQTVYRAQHPVATIN